MTTPIKPRDLEKKSMLIFEFPQEMGKSPLRVTLPFYENINITEKKKANYKKYNLLGRPSQLYTYTGSDSRKFSIDFHMSFGHILEEHGAAAIEQFRRYIDSENKAVQMLSFTQGMADALATVINEVAFRSYSSEARERFNIKPEEPKESEALNNVLNGLGSIVDGALGVVSTVRDNTPIINLLGGGGDTEGSRVNSGLQYDKVMDLVIYWTHVIRSSVTNHSENPIYGPPIVRLLHGSLFDDIPCICTNYTVSPVEEAGYDKDTMLPRRIKYSMVLEELRAGDYKKYERGNIVKRDNVVGWEAVINTRVASMDPGAIR